MVLTNYPDSFDVSFRWARYPIRDYLDLVFRLSERLVQMVSVNRRYHRFLWFAYHLQRYHIWKGSCPPLAASKKNFL